MWSSQTRTNSVPAARKLFAAALRMRSRLSTLCWTLYLMLHRITVIILKMQPVLCGFISGLVSLEKTDLSRTARWLTVTTAEKAPERV